MTVYTLADYTLAGATKTIAEIITAQSVTGIAGQAKWIQWQAVAVASSAAPIRVGAAAASGVGTALFSAGDGSFWPPVAEMTSTYTLTNAKVFGAAGDKVSISLAI